MNSLVTFFIFLIHILISTVMSSPPTATTALISLRSAVGGRTLLWNTTGDPCKNWFGVQCDSSGHVNGLRLPGVSLSGELPVGIFGELTQLRTLSLRLNSLSGQLPSDLSNCSELRNLYLQGNNFSGEIPRFLFSLRNLVKLDLGENRFHGELKPDLNQFIRLKTLYLQNNEFTGPIPVLKLSKLQQFNVSFNRLNGSVPASLGRYPISAFLGNELCGGPLQLCPEIARGVDVGVNLNGKKKRISGGVIAGIVIGSLLGVVFIFTTLFVLGRKKSGRNTRAVDIVPLKLQEVEINGEKPVREMGNARINVGGKMLVFFRHTTRVFELEELLRASAEVLGRGMFGTTYKANLEVGPAVAVKRLKEVTISEKEFKERILVLGGIEHSNLVFLRAYYFSRDEKLLVSDYMDMGSLLALLHGNKGAGRTPLNWDIRSSIALGVAHGIEYLHSLGPSISHGNIKSSNILLTESYDARISDFGLAHLVGPSSSIPTQVDGYCAPEVTDRHKISQKADVYSFGILLLELLTGKAPAHAVLDEEGIDLLGWVKSVVLEESTSEVLDMELLRDHNAEDEMLQLLQLAIDCGTLYPDKRPSMSEIARKIEDLRRSSLLEDQDPGPRAH